MTNIRVGLRKFNLFKNFLKRISSSRLLCTSVLGSSRNVDPEIGDKDTNKEIKHHANFASQWWDRCGPMKGLHSLNELRVPFIRDGLLSKRLNDNINDKNKFLDGFHILEVGCGGGILTESLAKLHSNVTGIDLGKEVISIAEEHSMSLNEEIRNRITYKVESIEEHVKENKLKYDAVVLSEVIEHIDNKLEFITNCIQALKCGGSVFVTTPNKTLASWLCVIGFSEYVASLVPKGTHTYEKFISPIDLRRMLDTFNCNTVLINGMIYDFARNKWIWTTITDFCYALQAIKMEQ